MSSGRSRRGGTRQRDRADAEVEVAAEPLLPHELGQVLVRGGDQPDVHAPVAHVAQPAEPLLLEHLQELGLDLEVDVADLVEKHRPAVRDLEQARLGGVAPVKAPFSWPKSSVSRNSRESPAQFRSTNASSARGPFSWSQRARTPLPAPVSPWIRTGLSEAATLPPRRRAPGSPRSCRGTDRAAPAPARAAGRLLLPVALVLEQPLEDHGQGLQLDRLRQELLRALLDRLDREVDRAVRGEDDDGHRGVQLPEAREQLERVAVRQRVVDDRDVRRRLAERRLGLGAALRLDDVESPAPQEVADAEAHRRLVVDEQDPVPDGVSHGRPHPGPPPAAARSRPRRPRRGCPPRSGRRGPRRCAGRSRGRGRCRRGGA